MSKSIYTLLKASKKTALKLYRVLRKVKGLYCIIRKPVTQGSIFGVEDVIDYDGTEREKTKYLIYGLFKEAQIGMDGYDTFIDDVYILTTYEEKLPQQTQVEVLFCGRTMTFKVDTHLNFGPTTCEQLFIKNILVPAT